MDIQGRWMMDNDGYMGKKYRFFGMPEAQWDGSDRLTITHDQLPFANPSEDFFWTG